MLRKFKYLLMLSFLITLSCNAGKSEIVKAPEDLLNRQQMSAILTDIHVAESKVSALNIFGDSLIQSNLDHYAIVFAKNNCSQDQFRSSFSYYLSVPVDLDSIYIDVLNNLTVLEAQHMPGYIQEKKSPADSSVMTKPN